MTALKAMRLSRNYPTMREVSRITGIKTSEISLMERGHIALTFDAMTKFSKLYSCTIADIL